MRFYIVALTIVLISNAALADASAPAMTLATVAAELSQEDCLTKAVNATRNNGFTENFEKLGKTVYGEKGGYTSAVRCETAAKLAIFVVAGSDAKITESSNNTIRATFAAP
jgi:hypothetical protein